MDKKELRKMVRGLKAQVTPEEKLREAQVVFYNIEALRVFKSARHILLYYSMPDELPTHEVVDKWALTKSIYLPRVKGDDLEILPYDPQSMTTGYKGIEEPAGDTTVAPAIIDLVIVPAMALDKHCNRCGRGRGYYDRLLPQCTHASRIAVALDCQFFDCIPTDEHDAKMNAVVTAQHLAFAKV